MAEGGRFSVASEPAFTPFWRRLPRFFVYPLQAGSIMRIGGYSVAASVFLAINPALGGLACLILWIIFLKYAFVVMERTANGRFDEPNNLDDKDAGETAQVMRQFGLFIIFGLLFGLLAAFFGKIGYALGWLIMNILPPAGIMIIGVNRSLGDALNPAKILYFIKTIGLPYLALCFVLMSVTGSGTWVQEFLLAHLHSWLVVPLVSFVEFYFALITYHMMGYVIYQYHDKLGVHAEVSFEKAEAAIAPNKAVDPFLARLGALMAEGKEEEAAGLLREELRTNWEKNDLHERYQRLLRATGKRDAALSHARDFIGKLIGEKRLFQAMDLFEQSLKDDPEFQMHNPGHVYPLASAAHLAKRHKLALDVMRAFDKRNPGHKDIAPVYFLSAQILGEHYGANTEAAKILRALQSKFPDHALAAEARQYMALLAAQQN
jgi:tetratricopeptide (TPR) repeat protein